MRVMRRRISSPGAFPPEDRPAAVIDESLEEHVVSSRGQAKAQVVTPKMSGYALHRRGSV